MNGQPAAIPTWIDLDRLARITPHPGWERNGNCYEQGDTDRFFPTRHGGVPHEAQAQCHGCPAVYACLAAALAQPEFNDKGYWGNTSERERRTLRRTLRQRRRAGESVA